MAWAWSFTTTEQLASGHATESQTMCPDQLWHGNISGQQQLLLADPDAAAAVPECCGVQPAQQVHSWGGHPVR